MKIVPLKFKVECRTKRQGSCQLPDRANGGRETDCGQLTAVWTVQYVRKVLILFGGSVKEWKFRARCFRNVRFLK